eukprot:TRINITY_DN1475_c0_g1_i1.p2 TRINITY_DN1475_c0_g1~~TRINITY_DN1475_c0_g1_i1.p2  ORF type:complete len:77 (-),score=5.01 TRINITY_DN1475_c0_g1_i1:28-258(-)
MASLRWNKNHLKEGGVLPFLSGVKSLQKVTAHNPSSKDQLDALILILKRLISYSGIEYPYKRNSDWEFNLTIGIVE